MDLSNLSSDVASTSSAMPKHRTILDPVSAPPTKVARNSYDVFLCHRGPDTKATLVDVLRAFLEAKGIDCFVDYQMEEGVDFPPAIDQAIRYSKVHIIVLSPGFAQSSWCLDEVEKIMEMQTSKASTHVLPIFFNVEPAHVRHQLSREYDLSQLHEARAKEKIVRWSHALAELTCINGFVCPTGRFQGQMIEEIVSSVDKFLWDSLPVYADSAWARGYATQIMQAEQILCLHNDDNVVSIGVCGIDKSRFARVLYNKFRQSFPAACILLDVKGRIKCKQDLVNLQMTLLQDLVNTGISSRIRDTVQGHALLLDRLKNVKCFIVLDDVEDDVEQLRSLLVLDQHQLGRGSRLVLTSRYPHVFDIRAPVKETIHLWHMGEVKEYGKRLAICWECNDVHEGFIDHLNESISMLGLDVSEVKGADLLNCAYQKQADVILVILSRSFVNDSTLMQGLDEASRLCQEVKLVCIYYGLQLGREVLSPSLSKMALQFPVDSQNTSRLDMKAFKSLINDIVWDHMQHAHEMYVTKFPVGLKKREEDLESQIWDSISKRKVGTFGILGMGGIGKTTLAKSLYNKICKKFEGAVFLHSVAAEAKQRGLVSLQQEAIATVLKTKDPISIRNVEEGKALLERKLHKTHSLIILDDVNDLSQLEALFSPLDLGRGSMVVITTRDRSILQAANVNHPYVMEYLDKKEARKLFYWHAFLKPTISPSGLEIIAQSIIDACGGLPLSLEVIGAHVYDHNDPEYWKETLVHLRKSGKRIFDTLRVSVDALESYQREAFLDVCCFLIGKPFQTALRVWEGCGWAAVTCMDVLKNKCLITVDPIDRTIRMHDHIRDMGRDVADGRTFRTHIWDAKDASDIPQDGIDSLHGFAMISQEEDENSEYKAEEEEEYTRWVHCEASDLARLRCSEVLLLRNLKIGGDFSNLLYDRIRWLQWRKSPFVNLPPGLHCSRQLRVLDLSDSEHLETLWGSSQSGKNEVPESLQELNLAGCSNLTELPQFDVYLQNLESLNLRKCTRLSQFHNSIGSLKKLKFLALGGCPSLRSLPDTIGGLHSLEKLHLYYCKSLDSLPEGIGRCRNLIEIVLHKIGVTNLPESFGKLRNLERLYLIFCEKLFTLPDSLGALHMLRECHLWTSSLQQLPERFCDLTSLITLVLRSSALRCLPDKIEGLRSLEKLNLSCCKSLDSLPEGIGSCRKLIGINLENTGVTNLPESVGKLRNLQRLCLRWCEKLVALPVSLGDLNLLTKCDLTGCKRLQQLPEKFCELTSLIELSLTGCDLENLPGRFGNLRNLTALSMGENRRLRSLPASMDDLRSLTKLDLRECPLEDEAGLLGELLRSLESLKKMEIEGAKIRSLDVSADNGRQQATFFPSSLKILSMTKCSNLERVSGLDRLKRLERLELRGCDKLRYLHGLEGLESLQELNISLCRALDSSRVVADILGSETLRRLYIDRRSGVPFMQLLQIPNLELLSWCGSELPGGFRDCSSSLRRFQDGTIDIDLCNDTGEQSTDGPSNFAAVLVSLLIPTGFYEEHSGERGVDVQLWWWPDAEDQVILLILRPGCEVLRRAQVNHKIQIRIRAYPWPLLSLACADLCELSLASASWPGNPQLNIQASYKVVWRHPGFGEIFTIDV